MLPGSAADSHQVGGSMPSWPTVVQCMVAGVVVGLVAVEAGAWRGELRRGGVRWSVAWTLSLATVCLLNGLYSAVAPGPDAEILLFGRYLTFGAAVVLSLPAVQAYTSGPAVRVLSALTTAWFVAGGVLWWTTPLLLEGVGTDGLPVYGPLMSVVELVPFVIVGSYVLRAVRGLEISTAGAVVTAAALASVVAVVAGSLLPVTAVTGSSEPATTATTEARAAAVTTAPAVEISRPRTARRTYDPTITKGTSSTTDISGPYTGRPSVPTPSSRSGVVHQSTPPATNQAVVSALSTRTADPLV